MTKEALSTNNTVTKAEIEAGRLRMGDLRARYEATPTGGNLSVRLGIGKELYESVTTELMMLLNRNDLSGVNIGEISFAMFCLFQNNGVIGHDLLKILVNGEVMTRVRGGKHTFGHKLIDIQRKIEAEKKSYLEVLESWGLYHNPESEFGPAPTPEILPQRKSITALLKGIAPVEAPLQSLPGDEFEEYEDALRSLEANLAKNKVLEDLKILKQWPPTRAIKPDHGPLVFSTQEPFEIIERVGSYPRKAHIVFVDCGGELKSRVIYASTTHGVIKSLPRISTDGGGNITWFDKADSENSISIGSDYQMYFIESIYKDGEHPQLDIKSEQGKRVLSTLVRKTHEGKQGTFYLKEVYAPIDELEDSRLCDDLGAQDTFYPELLKYKSPGSVHLQDANREEDPESSEYLEGTLIKTVNVVLPRYGATTIRFFESAHPSDPLKYMVLEAKMPQYYHSDGEPVPEKGIWIGAIETASPEKMGQNTYLVSKKYLAYDEVTTPLLDHSACKWPYIKKFPVIKAFGKKIEADSWTESIRIVVDDEKEPEITDDELIVDDPNIPQQVPHEEIKINKASDLVPISERGNLNQQQQRMLGRIKSKLEEAEADVKRIIMRKGKEPGDHRESLKALEAGYEFAATLLGKVLVNDIDPLSFSMEMGRLDKIAFKNPDDQPEKAEKRLNETGRYTRKEIKGASRGKLPSKDEIGNAFDALLESDEES